MSTIDVKEFISILKKQERHVTDQGYTLTPLTFNQQKDLITSNLDGIAGVISFIIKLNKIILENASLRSEPYSIVERTSLAIQFRKLLSSKPINGIEIQDLDRNLKQFTGSTTKIVNGEGYTITLHIPTLEYECVFLDKCLKALKNVNEDQLSQVVSTVLAFEMPKFIQTIEFGDSVIHFSSIPVEDKIKIVESLPADVTNHISEFISELREYDESLLTVGDVTLDLDSSFFE